MEEIYAYYSCLIAAMMKVRQDFFYYERGVYSSTGLTDSRDVGYHSVRIIGWGQDYGKKFWVGCLRHSIELKLHLRIINSQ